MNPKTAHITNFKQKLSEDGLTLVRKKTDVIQVNVGYKCNLACRHCHLSCGPQRHEEMTAETMDDVISYAGRAGFNTGDITGGAPEMNRDIVTLVKGLASVCEKTMIRLNLPSLFNSEKDKLRECLTGNKTEIIVSVPAVNRNQVEAQRGEGVWDKSIAALRELNRIGYGMEGTGLMLSLVSNPAGAFLPGNQASLEKRFRNYFKDKHDISFNNLYAFANVPLGRFKKWLQSKESYEKYMEQLEGLFNKEAVECVMCRTLVSVNWEGYLYDCDFNLAADLPYSGNRIHVSQMDDKPPGGAPIMTAEYCYTCTAGSGFT